MTSTKVLGGALIDPHVDVSRRTGFLPENPPIEKFPLALRSWDEIASEIPKLIASGKLFESVAKMDPPRISALKTGEEVQRAATLFGLLAHALVNLETVPVKQIPRHLLEGWREACRRLGRRTTYLSYADLIVHNWRMINSNHDRTVENMQVLIQVSGNSEERVFYLTQVEFLFRSRELPNVCLGIGDALVNRDFFKVECGISQLSAIARDIRTSALAKIGMGSSAPFKFDPIIWARTVAPVAVPILPGQPGASGTANPYFHAMDAILGRTNYGSFLGKECLTIRESYPSRWRTFIDALKRLELYQKVLSSGSKTLQKEFECLQSDYAELLEVHRKRATAVLEIAFKVGRQVTIGGFKGDFHDSEWLKINEEFKAAMAERVRPTLQMGGQHAIR